MCDRYFKNCLKQQTRTSRGVGTKVNFTDQTEFPTEIFLKNFLHNGESENALNEYLATKIHPFPSE